jgi:hypothetical protein
VAFSLLAGCANADFSEVNPTLVSDGIHDRVGPYATGSVPSKFELTDDERALRDPGYPLIETPYDRQPWYSVAGEYGVYRPKRGPSFDRTVYANRLLSSYDRSPSRAAADRAQKRRTAHARCINCCIGARKADAAYIVLTFRALAPCYHDAVRASGRRRACHQSAVSSDCTLPPPGADMGARAEFGGSSLTISALASACI